MARRVPDGPPPAPVVQRLRVRYAKRGRMRFTSTRDFQRALERAVRRAGLPMAFSAGFHPHPRISYANAAPTGVASEAEYVEISLTRQVDPSTVLEPLDAALPDGLDVTQVVQAPAGALADELQASVWALEFRGVDPQLLDRAVDGLWAARELAVSRMMKQGPRDVDVRAALVRLETRPVSSGVQVLATTRHTVPTVRPAEVWAALGSVAGTELPRPLSTRLAQGRVDADGVVHAPEP